MRRRGDGSHGRHAGLVHVAVILLLLHVDALMIGSRQDRSWARHTETHRMSPSEKSFLLLFDA